MKSKTRLVYILAASHSGSTLLARLLSSHPEVCTVGELKATSLGDIDRYRCSCRKNIKQCPFWMGISQDMWQRGFPFDVADFSTDLRAGASRYVQKLLQPLHRGPVLEGLRDMALALSSTWRSQLPDIQARNAALAESICIRTGKRIIVDSSKIGLRLKYLLRNRDLEVQMIRLIRDGRAVALAYTDPAGFADANEPCLRGGGMGRSRESERLSMAEAAWEWRRSNEEAEAILRRLDQSRWIEVRYEALCSQPEGSLQQLFAFMGISPTQGKVNFHSSEHHIIGNGMRLDTNTDICLDDRWRSFLTAQNLDVFETIAGKMNRQYGYQ